MRISASSRSICSHRGARISFCRHRASIRRGTVVIAPADTRHPAGNGRPHGHRALSSAPAPDGEPGIAAGEKGSRPGAIVVAAGRGCGLCRGLVRQFGTDGPRGAALCLSRADGSRPEGGAMEVAGLGGPAQSAVGRTLDGSCVELGDSRRRASPGDDIAHGSSARNRVQYRVIRQTCLLISG